MQLPLHRVVNYEHLILCRHSLENSQLVYYFLCQFLTGYFVLKDFGEMTFHPSVKFS